VDKIIFELQEELGTEKRAQRLELGYPIWFKLQHLWIGKNGEKKI
jgi:hypothetical protein